MTRESFPGTTRRGTGAPVKALVALLLAGGALTVTPALADTTGEVPDLPALREVDGPAGSLLNRHLGTGDQIFCTETGERLSEIAGRWEEANEAGARETANRLRYIFANANSANVQCLTAAGAALTSSGGGSVAGS
ncbi:hypothetical protein [Corynebacterium sp.]|uniref:hypothetical protein n=1 Tax=Corynebacterium sp. TaxID=1720 RepID=UPI0025B7FA9D|nr:hypothetical protein [Corynebacterium sp.]